MFFFKGFVATCTAISVSDTVEERRQLDGRLSARGFEQTIVQYDAIQ
jgi:hypothetical protein